MMAFSTRLSFSLCCLSRAISDFIHRSLALRMCDRAGGFGSKIWLAITALTMFVPKHPIIAWACFALVNIRLQSRFVCAHDAFACRSNKLCSRFFSCTETSTTRRALNGHTTYYATRQIVLSQHTERTTIFHSKSSLIKPLSFGRILHVTLKQKFQSWTTATTIISADL